jgi:hypothetical protein
MEDGGGGGGRRRKKRKYPFLHFAICANFAFKCKKMCTMQSNGIELRRGKGKGEEKKEKEKKICKFCVNIKK